MDHRWGLLPVRLVVGLILFSAGYQKLFQVGLATVQANFGRMGIPLPQLTGPFITGLELLGGLGLLLGAFTRGWGLVFAIEFMVTTFYVKLPQGWTAMRLDLLLLAVSLLLALEGAGPASVDAVRAADRATSPLDRRVEGRVEVTR
ncbi:MAG TPA: DoxX family protein [Methylomirabilota bacterium]|nr:DoxX family protein [Methylomirabilota bacterium]